MVARMASRGTARSASVQSFLNYLAPDAVKGAMVVRRKPVAAMLIRSVALMLLFAATNAAAVADPSPTEMLTGIYKEAVNGTTSDWLERKRRGRYLSKSLASLWARADAKKPPDGDVGPIDFDLTTDTNALELEGFDLKTESQRDAASVVAVRLIYRKPYVREGEAIVTYDFIREGGRWRIDNIRTAKWSVRDLLTRWLKGS
jgi:hypothetical protein